MQQPQSPEPVELSFDTRKLAMRVLVLASLAEIALVLLDYHINFGQATDISALGRLFNIAREDSLASWFASTQTLLVGLTAGFIACCSRHQPGKQLRTIGWMVLALFFVYMAADDGAQIHERLGTTYRALKEASGASLDFYPSYAWQVTFLPAFIALGLFMLIFLWSEFREKSSRVLLILAVCFIAVGVALDFIEGLEPEHRWNLYTWIGDNTDMDYWTLQRFDENAYETLQHFSKSIEEALEMFAHTLLWFLVLRHIPNVAPAATVQFTEL